MVAGLLGEDGGKVIYLALVGKQARKDFGDDLNRSNERKRESSY